MKSSFFITSAPFSFEAEKAFDKVLKAILKNDICYIFFYGDGVMQGNSKIEYSTDDFNILKSWEEIALKYKINLYFCSTSVANRGVTLSKNIHFITSGVSEFLIESINSERVEQL
ncbi:MAG: DsrE family protein [Psittacicella sp.]